MRKLALALIFSIFSSGPVVANYQIATTSSDSEKLAVYLKSHWKSPENYVISKFSNHDLVFIGEYHRIKHDVELIHKLIPRLYRAHVYNLGIEFGCYEHQDKVDRLITADTYDENLARWLIFEQAASWGYKEYQDIYRAAWKLNRSLPKRAPRFRVVNLNYKPNWPARKEEMTAA
ncbi:MAG: ChaN family lipoprotein, partial [Acidobacteriota bacterium]|nr:ChaN family lipoprotein [Acidobacteriota bacterium]